MYFFYINFDGETYCRLLKVILKQKGEVCKFKHSLYGLKQASRQCNHEFTTKLQNYSFQQFFHDNCLLVMYNEEYFLTLLIYIDDVLITGTHEEATIKVKNCLYKPFTIKDIGYSKYFLGVEIACSLEGIYISPG